MVYHTHQIHIKDQRKSECKILITSKIIVGNLMYLIQNLTSSENISKGIENLSNIIYKLNLTHTHTHMPFFSSKANITFFHVHGT